MFTVLPFGWVIVMAFFVAARVVFRDRRFFDRATAFRGARSSLEQRNAKVTAKRQHVSGGSRHWPTTTDYFATFEDQKDGARQEFAVSATNFSGLSEGDTGRLLHRDAVFLGFERDRAHSVGSHSAQTINTAHLKTCSYCGSALPHDMIKCANCGWGWRPDARRQG